MLKAMTDLDLLLFLLTDLIVCRTCSIELSL
jgi:hypothetical protein